MWAAAAQGSAEREQAAVLLTRLNDVVSAARQRASARIGDLQLQDKRAQQYLAHAKARRFPAHADSATAR